MYKRQEYTGTIVEAYLKKSANGKSASQMASLAQNGVKKDGLVTFNYAPGDNRQGIGMRTSVAKKYNIKTVSYTHLKRSPSCSC